MRAGIGPGHRPLSRSPLQSRSLAALQQIEARLGRPDQRRAAVSNLKGLPAIEAGGWIAGGGLRRPGIAELGARLREAVRQSQRGRSRKMRQDGRRGRWHAIPASSPIFHNGVGQGKRSSMNEVHRACSVPIAGSSRFWCRAVAVAALPAGGSLRNRAVLALRPLPSAGHGCTDLFHGS